MLWQPGREQRGLAVLRGCSRVYRSGSRGLARLRDHAGEAGAGETGGLEARGSLVFTQVPMSVPEEVMARVEENNIRLTWFYDEALG